MNTSSFLEQRAFSRIGEVIEISGKNVIIKVDKQKNNTNLFFKGEAYRSVGIGSYIKVKKDFLFIIGKIEKEFIKEKFVNQNSNENKREQYDRFIEISIVGYFEKGLFYRGLRELPFLYNETYLLSEKEIKQIFQYTDKYAISIGRAIFEEVDVEASITKLFASHIGIFGNTGSGKSNTLSRIHHNLLANNNSKISNHSKFIIIDFNGEYTNDTSIIKNKKNINLSTKESRVKIIINNSWLDEEFWGIVLQATDKTQKPFIKRAIILLEKQILSESLENIAVKLSERLRIILNSGGVNKQELNAFNLLKNSIKDLFNIKSELQFPGVFRKYTTHNGDFCRDSDPNEDHDYSIHSNGKIYFSKQENIEIEVINFRDTLLQIIKNFTGEISYFNFFHLALGLRLTDDVLYNIAQFDHVSPIIHRFEKRKNDLEKIFTISDKDFLSQVDNVLISISLKDLNLEMKKIVPLLICKKIYESHKLNEYSFKTLHLIIDEAHNILSEDSFRESESWKDYRLEVFEEIIKEGRKFGVFLTISSQRPSDISNTIISQLHNVFIHRLINNNDLQTMSKTISFLDKTSFESIPILPPGGCIFTGTATESPVAVQIPCLDKELQPRSETEILETLWFEDKIET